MPYRISRLGTVEIRSLDLDRDLDYYLNVLGLQLTAREGRTAYLKGWDERHAYSVVLTEADRAGMVRLAFRTVDPEDLDYYENRLRQFSVKYDVIPEDYRRGRALRFTVPSGHLVELYNDMDYTGNLLPTVNPAPWPEGLKGIAPPRLDHTLVTAPDPAKGNRFEAFGGYTAYQMDPDCRAIKWTTDQIGPAVFYYSQELNETFLSVYT